MAQDDAWFHRIKAATRDLVKACGGVERAAGIASVSTSVVSRWQVVAAPDVIPLPAVLALEAECGLAPVTAAMAALNGRSLALGDDSAGAAAGVFARHAEAVRAAAGMMAAGADALADGVLTPAEAELFDRAAGDVESALARLREDLAAAKAAGLRVVARRAGARR